jgi:hypothetical protein
MQARVDIAFPRASTVFHRGAGLHEEGGFDRVNLVAKERNKHSGPDGFAKKQSSGLL